MKQLQVLTKVHTALEVLKSLWANSTGRHGFGTILSGTEGFKLNIYKLRVSLEKC